jgi:hypothetical protein
MSAAQILARASRRIVLAATAVRQATPFAPSILATTVSRGALSPRDEGQPGASNNGSGKDDVRKVTGRFVPSHEWQEVVDGQALPPGLHIRVNFSTGKTEARLLR